VRQWFLAFHERASLRESFIIETITVLVNAAGCGFFAISAMREVRFGSIADIATRYFWHAPQRAAGSSFRRIDHRDPLKG
jgi:hypothetical protein